MSGECGLAAALAALGTVGTGFASLLSNAATAERGEQSGEAAAAAPRASWRWGLLVLLGRILHLFERRVSFNFAIVCREKNLRADLAGSNLLEEVVVLGMTGRNC
jgi:hypothetical protein